MFWEHIFQFLVQHDYSHLRALTIYTYKGALVLVQQCQPPSFRHRQKLCRILGSFRLIRYKQPFLFCDIFELWLFQPLVIRLVELYRPTGPYLSSVECLVSSR